MFKQGTWDGEAEIQAFTEVYNVNVMFMSKNQL